MASPESSYSETGSSIVTTRPRVREEVREEMREEIRLLDMTRVGPEDKLKLERAAVETSVGDVELFERTWRKTRPESLADIQRRVDAMGTGPELPERAPASRPVPRAASVGDVSPAPAPLPSRSGRPLGARLSPSETKAVAKHLGGQVTRATVAYATSRGRVVEVQYKKDDEALRATVVVSEGNQVATLDDIRARLDAMPLPSGVPARPAAPAAQAGEEDEEAPSPPPTQEGQPIEDIEGVGEVYGRKLRKAGVPTVEALLDADVDAVARASGISADLVGKWQSMARLQAVHGIGPQYSELLVRAGIGSLEELAVQKPESLARRLNAYEASLEKRVQGNDISPRMVEGWIEQAREMTGIRGAASGKTAPISDLGISVSIPASPEAAEEDGEAEEAEETEEEAPKKKGFGLKLGRRAAADAPEAGEAPKKKGFGLKLGKKPARDEAAEEEAADEEAAAEEEAEDEAPKKKGFGLKLGRKK